jgi:hypothetical protein
LEIDFSNITDNAASSSCYQQKAVPAPHQSYQLARFVNEQADYKALVVSIGDAKGIARKGARLSALRKRMKDVESLV